MHKVTQKIHRATKKLGRVRAVPRFCGHHPGICLTTEEIACRARRKLISLLYCRNSYFKESFNTASYVSSILLIVLLI
jgi:hypothetical protein